MIIAFFLQIVYLVVFGITYPLRILPDVSTDSGVSGAISTALAYLANLNNILPITTLFEVVGLILTIELVLMAYKIIMWVVRRIPTQS